MIKSEYAINPNDIILSVNNCSSTNELNNGTTDEMLINCSTLNDEYQMRTSLLGSSMIMGAQMDRNLSEINNVHQQEAGNNNNNSSSSLSPVSVGEASHHHHSLIVLDVNNRSSILDSGVNDETNSLYVTNSNDLEFIMDSLQTQSPEIFEGLELNASNIAQMMNPNLSQENFHVMC